MSLASFSELIAKYPGEKRTLKRLETLTGKEQSHEYTFAHLYKKLAPSSPEALALILEELVRRGMLQRVFRVESRASSGGIRDFSSLMEVPERIADSRTEEQFSVAPDDVRVIFKL